MPADRRAGLARIAWFWTAPLRLARDHLKGQKQGQVRQRRTRQGLKTIYAL